MLTYLIKKPLSNQRKAQLKLFHTITYTNLSHASWYKTTMTSTESKIERLLSVIIIFYYKSEHKDNNSFSNPKYLIKKIISRVNMNK